MPRHNPSDPVWTVPRAQADIVFCNLENLQKVVNERQAMAFVWHEEGEFLPNGDWRFNEDHTPEAMEVDAYEPLLMDIQTAALLLDLRDRLNGLTTKGLVRKEVFDSRLVQSRAYLGLFIDGAYKFAARAKP